MRYNEQQKTFIVKYNSLPNNMTSATTKLRSKESLIRKLSNDHQRIHTVEMDDVERRNLAKESSSEEIVSNVRLAHYQIHEALKSNLVSNPVHILFNSFESCIEHALNEYWTKTMELIDNLHGIILQFKEHLVAIVAEITKMYNSRHLSKGNQLTPSYFWRNLRLQRRLYNYIFVVVLGDRLNSISVLVARHTLVKRFNEQYLNVANMSKNNSYVSDIKTVLSCSSELITIKQVQDIKGRCNITIKY